MNWPQIVVIVCWPLDVAQERLCMATLELGKHNFGLVVFNMAVWAGLLYLGHFWDKV